MHNHLRGEKNSFLKAQWEAKTDNKIIKRIAQSRMEDIRKRAESDIISRSAKLAALLAAED